MRRENTGLRHYNGWSDKYIWEQIVLDEAGFSDRAGIMQRAGRVVDYNYQRVEDRARGGIPVEISHRAGIVMSIRRGDGE